MTRTGTGTHTGTGTWTTGVTAITLCTSCSWAKNPKRTRKYIIMLNCWPVCMNNFIMCPCHWNHNLFHITDEFITSIKKMLFWHLELEAKNNDKKIMTNVHSLICYCIRIPIWYINNSWKSNNSCCEHNIRYKFILLFSFTLFFRKRIFSTSWNIIRIYS